MADSEMQRPAWQVDGLLGKQKKSAPEVLWQCALDSVSTDPGQERLECKHHELHGSSPLSFFLYQSWHPVPIIAKQYELHGSCLSIVFRYQGRQC